MHDTELRRKARLIKRKSQLEAKKLQQDARIEDTTVRLNPLTKTTKGGEIKTYWRWVASWRDGERTTTKYLGSKDKLTEAQALMKAKQMKSEFLKTI
jgi:hypothetical protein